MIYIYDIEVFPNFFSLLMISEDGEVEYVFIKFGSRNDIPAMICFLTSIENLTLVSYNGVAYDEPMLRAILEKPDMTNNKHLPFLKL